MKEIYPDNQGVHPQNKTIEKKPLGTIIATKQPANQA
jgi:hypothetical protein